MLLPLVASADVCALQNEEKEPYAVLSEDNTVLTFYYDNQKAARNGMDVGPFYGYNGYNEVFPLWYGQRENITSVVFDATFANCTTLTSTAYWFYGLQNLSSITGISNLKTDNVTDMQDMFAGCSHLTSLDLKEFKTDNVTNMNFMFYSCFGLTSLDLTGFKTGNVTNMHGMFYGCSGLTSLDLTGVRTDNVTDMGGMFGSCSNLTSLDVSGFKTDNVMDMSCVFQACFGLTSLDVSGFKTDNVTNMLDMFSFCSGLMSLDVTGFKTDNVTNMGGMFRDCSGLTNLDVTGFKTDIVTDMHEMFDRCSGLTSLDVTGFKTDNVTDMGGMFSGCSGLTNLDVTGFKTDKVTSMWNMFARCSGLTNLDMTGFKTDNVTNMDGMFRDCSGLTNLDVSGFKTDKVTQMYSMFSNCSSLTNLDLTGFKTDNVTDMRSMFFGCSGLKSLDVTGFKTDNVMDMGWLFSGCSSLKTIYAGDGWSTAKVQNGESMFTDCTSLVGGAGTHYDGHTDHTYARIDGGASNPGYFTGKNAMPDEDPNGFSLSFMGQIINDGATLLINAEGWSALGNIYTDPDGNTKNGLFVFVNKGGKVSGSYSLEILNNTLNGDLKWSIGGETYSLNEVTNLEKSFSTDENGIASVKFSAESIPNEGSLSAKLTVTIGNKTKTFYLKVDFKKKDSPDLTVSGKVGEPVDLGLNVKWASWNVGAGAPEEYGNHYAWGELEPKTDYSASTYKFYDNGYTKYGSIDSKYELDEADDVARQKWGEDWRMPTINELKELYEKCSFTRETINGVPVTKVTGPKGNYIYMPGPGNFTGSTLYFKDDVGSYWSRNLENDSYAKDLDFFTGSRSLSGDTRYHGQSVRPVYVGGLSKRIVHVIEAGTLPTLISEEEKYTIEELTITGNLNGTDIRLLRDMAGCNYLGDETQGKLKVLDISETNIVAGGNSYIDTNSLPGNWGGDLKFSIEKNDILPRHAFHGCKFTTVLIPKTVTRIESCAFYCCPNLHNITIPTMVQNIGERTFGKCGLHSIIVESGNTKFDSRNNCNAIIEKKSNTLILGCKNTVIPETVTTIGNGAFYECADLVSFIIPNSVTSIGDNAFRGNGSLSSVTIPNSVISIGKNAFDFCRALTSITIPNSVTTIGNDAFRYCVGLSSITIPASVTSIGNGAFSECNGLNSVISEIDHPYDIPEDVFVSAIYSKAKLIVPSGKISTYQATAGWNKFETIVDSPDDMNPIKRTIHVEIAGTLPSLIPDEEKYAINELTLTGELNGTDFRLIRDMAGNNYLGQMTRGALKVLDISGASIVAGGEKYLDTEYIKTKNGGSYSSQYHCELEEADVFPNYVLAGCMLESVILPKTVIELGNGSCSLCEELITVEIPESVKTIRSGCFGSCRILPTILIPKSVDNIEVNPLEGSNLSKIVVDSENPVYDSRGNCNAIIETATNTLISGCKNTIIPEGITSIGRAAFYAYQELTEITIPNSVTTIREQAFSYCRELTNVTFSDNLNNIGFRAFFECSKLTSITIPTSVVSIGYDAFSDCEALSSIVVEDNNSVYDSRNNCNAIIESATKQLLFGCKNTKIPDGILEINDNAGIGTMEVIIPYSVRFIGNKAFTSRVRSVTVESRWPLTISASSFANRDRITLYVPKGCREIYAAANYWKDFKEIVEIESITISSAKQVTFMSDRDLDFTGYPDLKAYVATGYDKASGTIWLTRVKEVPAMTGFLLMGEADTYEIPAKTGESTSYYMNLFKGTIEGTTIYTADGDYTNYYLSNGDAGVGFYKVTKADGVTLAANRAYLSVPTDIPFVGSTGGTETITVSSAKQVPYFSSQSLDFSSLDEQGVKAYTATGYDYNSGTIWLTRVKQVPAETGILIMAPQGEYPVPTASVASVYANMFKGTLTGTTIQTHETIAGEDYINYYLSNGDAGVGFYRVTKEEGVNLNANRCYLPIKNKDAAAGTRSANSDVNQIIFEESDEVIGIQLLRGIGGDENGTTSIKDLTPALSEGEGEWYTLQGQRVAKPGKGLYIKNGKVVVIK